MKNASAVICATALNTLVRLGAVVSSRYFFLSSNRQLIGVAKIKSLNRLNILILINSNYGNSCLLSANYSFEVCNYVERLGRGLSLLSNQNWRQQLDIPVCEMRNDSWENFYLTGFSESFALTKQNSSFEFFPKIICFQVVGWVSIGFKA